VRVVAHIERGVRVDSVRGSGADLEVRREGRPAVRRVGGPDLEVVVRDAVGVSAPAGSQIVAGVVPRQREISCRLSSAIAGSYWLYVVWSSLSFTVADQVAPLLSEYWSSMSVLSFWFAWFVAQTR
jgi:hypothetical protein